MRLIPSDPDVQTIVTRINDGDIDLQPDFQRGEIWSLPKRQKLIDSILRNWHIPPIHVILESHAQQLSVLDGQQRLASIRDFVSGSICVDGQIEPLDPKIMKLDGMFFDELSHDVQKRFLQFPLRLFTITDYNAAEPGELFYRLNQPTSLTAAEQRNAFFGIARKQVKELVVDAEVHGLSEGLFGFSNARMAYDDVIAKVLSVLDAGTLREKVTANVLADKYRGGEAFEKSSVRKVRAALSCLGGVHNSLPERIKLNKATAQSWITFFALCSEQAPEVIRTRTATDFFLSFEDARKKQQQRAVKGDSTLFHQVLGKKFASEALFIYESRSVARVADVSSVVLRDLVIWLFLFAYVLENKKSLRHLSKDKSGLLAQVRSSSLSNNYGSLSWVAEELNWGEQL